MEKIESFRVNHDILQRGVYVSRIDGDIVTYDIRTRVPNCGDYMSNAAMHTIEHIFATFVRNSHCSDKVIYFGPMGCRTGFYLILRDSVSRADALALIRDAFLYCKNFQGEIPGSKKIECGNYLEHNLKEAQAEASSMASLLFDYKPDQMIYPQ